MLFFPIKNSNTARDTINPKHPVRSNRLYFKKHLKLSFIWHLRITSMYFHVLIISCYEHKYRIQSLKTPSTCFSSSHNIHSSPAGQMRISLRLWGGGYLHLATNLPPEKWYNLVTFWNEDPPSVPPALRSSALLPSPGRLCVWRCRFNEGSQRRILPLSSTFTLTWLHKILFWSFVCCTTYFSALEHNKCCRKTLSKASVLDFSLVDGHNLSNWTIMSLPINKLLLLWGTGGRYFHHVCSKIKGHNGESCRANTEHDMLWSLSRPNWLWLVAEITAYEQPRRIQNKSQPMIVSQAQVWSWCWGDKTSERGEFTT